METAETKKIGYRDLFVEKNYLKSFCANMVNRFGDSIDALAFAWMVYEISGDRAWSAIIFGLNTLPTILLMPLAGVFVEKYDKRRIMIITDLGRALLVSLIALLYMLGVVTPWMLGASTFLMSTFEAFRIPAGIGLYPRIVPREKYTVATSFSQSCSSVSAILGTGAFGLVVGTLGLQGAMFINAATFLISAFFIFRINLPVEAVKDMKLSVKHFFVQLKEGVSYFYTRKIIFLICTVGSFIGVLFVPINALITPYVQESLGLGEYALSTISIASMAGTMLGTALFPTINRKFGKVALFIVGGVGASLEYIALALISFLPSSQAMYVCLAIVPFICGFFMSFINVVVNVAFMEQIETEYLGRVGAIFNSMASMLSPIASFLIAGVTTIFTVNQVFVVSGILAAGTFVALSLSKLFRQIDLPVSHEKGETV